MSVLTHLPQTDSSTLDIWKRMLAPAATLERVLEELYSVLRDQQLCMIFNITTVDFGLLHLTVMRPTEEILQELCKPGLFQMFLKIRSLPILWLVLRGLALLSERPEMAREIRTLLPDIMETLQFVSAHITLNVLNIFRNVVNHLGKMEARPIALELAENLLHLFNHVSSEIRARSILLFKDVIEAVVWWQKGDMKKKVHRGLLPLLFLNSDETLSVAQASREALIACAKFLKWKELEHQAQKKNIVGIMECLPSILWNTTPIRESVLWQLQQS
ncbi:maestro heat-like repeat-containing protein family member 7 isoform X2 [Numida meleagris]|uniref:maestro heat-like repeat-containing protein family member 7 isoform X2 n=1 Tax=Numida meleagris TaxID=8996 RepID=UPI000B3E3AB3|nr:maestro heat-like repeat-containing protein family member 7 isoform X2 [Numida meleagris]